MEEACGVRRPETSGFQPRKDELKTARGEGGRRGNLVTQCKSELAIKRDLRGEIEDFQRDGAKWPRTRHNNCSLRASLAANQPVGSRRHKFVRQFETTSSGETAYNRENPATTHEDPAGRK